MQDVLAISSIKRNIMYIIVLLYIFVDLEFANIYAYGYSDYIFFKGDVTDI